MARPKAVPRSRELVLVAGGDVNLGRGIGQRILADPSYDPFANVASILATGDLRFINLESPLSDQRGETQSPYHPLVFTGPPHGAQTLVNAGIDIVSTANNHAWDYGRSAFEQTIHNLEKVKLPYVGTSITADEQYSPTIVRKGDWSVAFFAVTHIWNLGPFQQHVGRKQVAWANFERLKNNIAAARSGHDLVLMSYHGGVEYVHVPYAPTRRFAAEVMAAGVDAFIGHHPHVPHGIGWYSGRPALYSLGNLVFDKRNHPWERTSYLARLRFRRPATADAGAAEVAAVEICPYHLRGHEPRPFAGPTREADERRLRKHLEGSSIPLGGLWLGGSDALGCMPARPRGVD